MNEIGFSRDSCFGSYNNFKHCYPRIAGLSSSGVNMICELLKFKNKIQPYQHLWTKFNTFKFNEAALLADVIWNKGLENYVCHGISFFSVENISKVALGVLQHVIGGFSKHLSLIANPPSTEIGEQIKNSFSDPAQYETALKTAQQITGSHFLDYTNLVISLSYQYFFGEAEAIRNQASKSLDPLIHRAAAAGQKHLVEHFITEGYQINLRDDEGNTALHKAAEIGSYHVAITLIDHKIDVRSRNDKGENFVDLAIKNSHEFFIAEILKAEVKFDREEALVTAILAGNKNIVALLLDHKADPKKTISALDKTPYQVAFEMNLVEILAKMESKLNPELKKEDSMNSTEALVHAEL